MAYRASEWCRVLFLMFLCFERTIMSRPLSTAAGNVYDKLLFSILTAECGPGEPLQEVPLSEKFKVSRSVIRDALIGLEDDGLVSSKPKDSARVRFLPRPEEIVGSQEARFYLESLSGCELIQRLEVGAATLDKIEQLHANMEKIAKTKPKDAYKQKAEFLLMDIQFHLEITREAGCLQFERLLNRLLHSVRIHSLPVFQNYEKLEVVVKEHLEILEGLQNRNPKKFVAATIAHLDNATLRWLSQESRCWRSVASRYDQIGAGVKEGRKKGTASEQKKN